MSTPRVPPATIERFHHLAIRLLRALRQVDERHGLSGPRASALSVLVFRGPQTLGELAAAEGVRAPTMSRLVKAMGAEGLVAVGPGEDQRRIRIVPTARGRRLMLEGRDLRLAALAGMLKDASAAEARALESVVGLLARSLGQG
ncbi:MAG TPA: MarR family transcriptional regulator [Usitatibacter sp.]|nr:MarR family transcriptional regulator [Usitatibacter sp.]